ncbi:hypothetical protein [Patulibacter sp.]|uniref:hypothetical protein n=1 Tax=Patulibacter sp. TaxID=1912859 RepID=UPI0027205E4C|nr:hypothetical protein [Patulibacter sp.]MDO9409695.1 hypothetical protein [Patulibacter sp.]
MVVLVLEDLRRRGYFQKAFGYECVDGDVDGEIQDPEAHFFLTTRRRDVWPYWTQPQQVYSVWDDPTPPAPPKAYENWDEDTLMDVVEALHDVVAKPTRGAVHDFGGCGYHASSFLTKPGRREFIDKVNVALAHHSPPFEMNEDGEVVVSTPGEFRNLMAASVPESADAESVSLKVEHAKRVFTTRGSSIADRRDAVTNLAAVLEAMRDEVRALMLREDESALFLLANGFAIRHNKRDQRRDYDSGAWLQWAFYVYLSTIHTVLYLKDRELGG